MKCYSLLVKFHLPDSCPAACTCRPDFLGLVPEPSQPVQTEMPLEDRPLPQAPMPTRAIGAEDGIGTDTTEGLLRWLDNANSDSAVSPGSEAPRFRGLIEHWHK